VPEIDVPVLDRRLAAVLMMYGHRPAVVLRHRRRLVYLFPPDRRIPLLAKLYRRRRLALPRRCFDAALTRLAIAAEYAQDWEP
jgi:hypothetical protein